MSWGEWYEATPIEKSLADKQEMAKSLGITMEQLNEGYKEARKAVILKNKKYQVSVFDDGNMLHLSVKRIDKEPIHDWRDLQRIKNELVGAENEGVELYPAESRKVDTANQYHLWVYKDVKTKVPVGFNTVLVNYDSAGGAKQRPLEK